MSKKQQGNQIEENLHPPYRQKLPSGPAGFAALRSKKPYLHTGFVCLKKKDNNRRFAKAAVTLLPLLKVASSLHLDINVSRILPEIWYSRVRPLENRFRNDPLDPV